MGNRNNPRRGQTDREAEHFDRQDAFERWLEQHKERFLGLSKADLEAVFRAGWTASKTYFDGA